MLTAQLRARVERELASGTTHAAIAQRTGVSQRTLARWLAAGRVARPTGPPPAPLAPAGMSLPERLEQAEPGLVGAVIASAQRGHWQAAAWLLERSFPERWARREPAPPPVQDQFTEIDELSRRRARPHGVRGEDNG